MVGTSSPVGRGGGHEVLDELDLEGLVEPKGQAGGARTGLAGPEHRERLVHRQLEALDRLVLAHDPGHLLLDARQVGLGDGLGKLEVVVEAVLDGRADGVPGAREEADDRLRHDVGRGVALDVDGVGVLALERDDVEAVAVVQRRGRVDQQGDVRVGGGGHAARDGGLGQSRADRRRGVAHGRAVVEFERGAVGKGDVQGHAGGPFSACAPAHLAGAVDQRIVAGAVPRGTGWSLRRGDGRPAPAPGRPGYVRAPSRRAAKMRAWSSWPPEPAWMQSSAPAANASPICSSFWASRMM